MSGRAEQPPRDPFAVDIGAALEVLQATWGEHYHVWYEASLWHARRHDGAGFTLSCETPGEIERAMRGAL